jgi:acetyl-CoA C-acetyltransferase
MSQPVYVLGSARTPFTRSFSEYAQIQTQDLMLESLKNLVQKTNLTNQLLGDVALGGVMIRSSDWNLGRECVLGAGLHPRTPGYTVQRACGTSLETFIQIGLKIERGMMDSGIAAGVDSNSDLPILFSRQFGQKLLQLNAAKTSLDKVKSLFNFSINDLKPEMPAVVEPRTGKSMGQHCELMVQEWKISRQDQDQLAMESHQKAAAAYEQGFHKTLVHEFMGLKKDKFVRGDTTLEKLSSLKPAFDKTGAGSLTAGNSTPFTDGSAAVLLGSESGAQRLGLKPLARFVDAEIAALDFVGGEGLLMAPALAVARMLERNKMKLQDFDYYEIHEAFAGQVLCTLKAWQDQNFCKNNLKVSGALGEIDRKKMNVVGGSLALGHPFGATGARIVGALAQMLSQNSASAPKKRGLISICTAGGMGVAAIFESV